MNNRRNYVRKPEVVFSVIFRDSLTNFDDPMTLVDRNDHDSTSTKDTMLRGEWVVRKYILVSIWFVLGLMLVSCEVHSASSSEQEKETNSPVSDSSDQQNDRNEDGKSSNETDDNEGKVTENGDNQEAEQPKTSGLEFTRPEAVRGIYVTGHSAGGSRFEKLLDLVDGTDLNSMVIDIKDDYGNITYKPDDESPLASFGKPYMKDPEAVLKTLHEHDIYPIARIVVFKDSVYAEENPELSFRRGENLWRNGRDEAFVSPFQKKVWEHNIEVAKEAAKMGFQDIQFDYVRFPEGFENLTSDLSYGRGDYVDVADDVEARVQAVTDFVAYAKKELEPFDVDISVDVFGFTVMVPNSPGIGQDIVKIGEHVDVLSSMIYPSHWGVGNLGIEKPDLKPYQLVKNYAVKEKEKLFRMETPPTSRPWIQDFTASWLGSGYYKEYGKAEVEAQIKALNEAGIEEFLVWNPKNTYTENVDYTPELDSEVVRKIEQQDKALKEAISQENDQKGDNDQVAMSEGKAQKNHKGNKE